MLFSGGNRYLAMLGALAILQGPSLLAGILTLGATATGNTPLLLVVNLLGGVVKLAELQRKGYAYLRP